MKQYLLTSVITLSLAAVSSADTIKARVNGMVCGFCATGIEKTFKAQPEVKSVSVDLPDRLVTVSTKEGKTMDDAKLKKLIANAGYSVVSVEHSK
jgi:mercuric ion binding protein